MVVLGSVHVMMTMLPGCSDSPVEAMIVFQLQKETRSSAVMVQQSGGLLQKMFYHNDDKITW